MEILEEDEGLADGTVELLCCCGERERGLMIDVSMPMWRVELCSRIDSKGVDLM